jgi:hypothetical protein
MEADEKKKINGMLIENYYWNGRFLTYVDHKLTAETFESACEKVKDGRSDEIVWL